MSEKRSTPYSDLTDEQLFDELRQTDKYIKEASDHLDWAKENDPDSGIIDAIDQDAQHAVADYNWILQEIWNRGYMWDSTTKEYMKSGV